MKNLAHYKHLGVIGYPVSHSLSPLIHTTALRRLELPWFYSALPVPPERLKEFTRNLQLFNFSGINVTIPHKVAIIDCLDELDENARRIGAVNTVEVRSDGTLKGYNTDGDGFLDALRRAFHEEAKDKKILFLGAGGAVRGVCHRLLRETPKEVIIANRTASKAESLKEEFSAFCSVPIRCASTHWDELIDIAKEADWIINGTSVGMKPEDPQLLPAEAFLPKHIVVDMIYSPPETKLLKDAGKQGAKTLNGLGMLIHQAAKSFEIWTGEKMPVQEVTDRLKKLW